MKTQYANGYDVAGAAAERNGGLGQWLAGLFGSLRTRNEEHGRYVQTREELMSLSDRELDDVGLLRSDIEQIARESARLAG